MRDRRTDGVKPIYPPHKKKQKNKFFRKQCNISQTFHFVSTGFRMNSPNWAETCQVTKLSANQIRLHSISSRYLALSALCSKKLAIIFFNILKWVWTKWLVSNGVSTVKDNCHQITSLLSSGIHWLRRSWPSLMQVMDYDQLPASHYMFHWLL